MSAVIIPLPTAAAVPPPRPGRGPWPNVHHIIAARIRKQDKDAAKKRQTEHLRETLQHAAIEARIRARPDIELPRAFRMADPTIRDTVIFIAANVLAKLPDFYRSTEE
jgi:hypothetical protein